MTIQLIFKIAAVGIVVALINQVLKHSGRDDQAYLVSLAGLIIVLTWIFRFQGQRQDYRHDCKYHRHSQIHTLPP